MAVRIDASAVRYTTLLPMVSRVGAALISRYPFRTFTVPLMALSWRFLFEGWTMRS